MNSFTIEANIKSIETINQFQWNGQYYKSQNLVLTTPSQWGEQIQVIRFNPDKVDLRPYTAGERVKVGFNINSKQVNSQKGTFWNTTLNGFSIVRIVEQAAQTAQTANYQQQQPQQQQNTQPPTDDGLPF